MMKAQRTIKSTLFTMLYSDKAKLLRLYNAVNGTRYTNEDDLEITTLENAIYVNMKNDISFIFDSQLNLYEHQSTVNPNMPLRNLLYVSRTIQRLVEHENLYGSKQIKIPTPRFVVFYNGTKRQPGRQVLNLSEAFLKPMEVPELELKVTVININADCGDEILKECRELWEYSQFIEMTRNLAREMPFDKAVELAVDVCIQEGILSEFLTKNKAEAIEMSIFEFDQEKYDAALREEGYEDGLAEGKAEGKAEVILELLQELGEVPIAVREMIFAQTDLTILSHWIKIAIKAETLKYFIEESGFQNF